MNTEDAFTRIALTAANAFLSRGYSGVSLRALADELGIKPASLYYHCPRGKAELYARSLTAFFDSYRDRLRSARGRARFPERLMRMTDAMLADSPIDLQRIVRVDLPNLDDADARAVMAVLHDGALGPFSEVFDEARASGAVKSTLDSGHASACVLALVDGLGFLHLPSDRDPTAVELRAARRSVRKGIVLLIDGSRGA